MDFEQKLPDVVQETAGLINRVRKLTGSVKNLARIVAVDDDVIESTIIEELPEKIAAHFFSAISTAIADRITDLRTSVGILPFAGILTGSTPGEIAATNADRPDGIYFASALDRFGYLRAGTFDTTDPSLLTYNTSDARRNNIYRCERVLYQFLDGNRHRRFLTVADSDQLQQALRDEIAQLSDTLTDEIARLRDTVDTLTADLEDTRADLATLADIAGEAIPDLPRRILDAAGESAVARILPDILLIHDPDTPESVNQEATICLLDIANIADISIGTPAFYHTTGGILRRSDLDCTPGDPGRDNLWLYNADHIRYLNLTGIRHVSMGVGCDMAYEAIGMTNAQLNKATPITMSGFTCMDSITSLELFTRYGSGTQRLRSIDGHWHMPNLVDLNNFASFWWNKSYPTCLERLPDFGDTSKVTTFMQFATGLLHVRQYPTFDLSSADNLFGFINDNSQTFLSEQATGRFKNLGKHGKEFFNGLISANGYYDWDYDDMIYSLITTSYPAPKATQIKLNPLAYDKLTTADRAKISAKRYTLVRAE